MPALKIVQISCLADNFCVLLHDEQTAATLAIDAPQAATIAAALDELGWRLSDIFITHHHGDHTGGCRELKTLYGCAITGPDDEADRIAHLDRTTGEGQALSFAGTEVRVLATPGHTSGHVSYYIPAISTVFTGDTLFALGCGRIFEGDATKMYGSLAKLAALPDDTSVYCGHEYTLANARFALGVEPGNSDLVTRVREIEALRASGRPTLPTTIGLEKATNPFLRAGSKEIRSKLGLEHASDVEVFARLRDMKNRA